MGSKALGVLDIANATGIQIPLKGVPVQIALAKDGSIYASLYSTRQVAQITPDTQISYIDLPADAQGPLQIDVTPDQQYLLIADQGGVGQDEAGNKLYVYDRESKIFT